jgi:hypothetical protein
VAERDHDAARVRVSFQELIRDAVQ